jgi:hypothetical protein
LSIEKGQYNTWSELFKIHARVHQVIDHIIPTEPAPSPELKVTDPQERLNNFFIPTKIVLIGDLKIHFTHQNLDVPFIYLNSRINIPPLYIKQSL